MRPTFEELEEGWQALAPRPRDSGEIAIIVTRGTTSQMAKGDRPPGYHVLSSPLHACPRRVELCPEQGVIGDRWNPKKNKLGDQISLGSLAVARLVTANAPERFHLLGDNFIVDFDLSADSVPVGTQLQLGTATIEITDEPYTPCNRYQARFGKLARHWVEHKDHAGRHLRGRYAQVITGGFVQLGDRVSR